MPKSIWIFVIWSHLHKTTAKQLGINHYSQYNNINLVLIDTRQERRDSQISLKTAHPSSWLLQNWPWFLVFLEHSINIDTCFLAPPKSAWDVSGEIFCQTMYSRVWVKTKSRDLRFCINNANKRLRYNWIHSNRSVPQSFILCYEYDQ